MLKPIHAFLHSESKNRPIKMNFFNIFRFTNLNYAHVFIDNT